jgi:hypothetical protein
MGSREEMILTKRQKSILMGKILGDATLERNGRNVRLRISQTDRQKDYVIWLYEELRDFTTKKPRIVKTTSSFGVFNQFRFDTFSLPVFNYYREMFYKKGKKIIPHNINHILKEPLCLAIWYMDDGYKRTDNSGLYICSSGFTIKENNVLQHCLKINFGIETNLHFAGSYVRLHIPSRFIAKFSKLVKPFILPSFRYKLP